jgi:hypothetical protein
MKTKMQLIDVIRHGEFKMSYNFVKCSRCFRNDVKEYLIFKDYILCTKCIDNININNPKPIPLVTMQQNIYYNEINYNNIYHNEINEINECINNFKIIEKVSQADFKVKINDKSYFIKPTDFGSAIMQGESREFRLKGDRESNSVFIDDKTIAIEIKNSKEFKDKEIF